MSRRWQSQASSLRSHARLGAVLFGFRFLAGCDPAAGSTPGTGAASFDALCESAGLCDEAPAPPELVDVLCDASPGSSCNRENARATIEAAARFVGTRPGARLRVWALGPTMAETRTVGELPAPAPTRRTRSREAHLDRFVAHARATLTLALEPALARPGVRRSPLLESVAKIGLADGGGLPRRLVVVSDARECSAVGEFECGRLPSDAEFARVLRRRRLLVPGALDHVEVTFAFVTAAPVGSGRCAVSIAREARIRELWRAALTTAGSSLVRFDSGAPVLVGERPPRSPAPARPTPTHARRNVP